MAMFDIPFYNKFFSLKKNRDSIFRDFVDLKNLERMSYILVD